MDELKCEEEKAVEKNITKIRDKMTSRDYQERIAAYIQKAIGGSILRGRQNWQNPHDKHDYERELVKVEKHMRIKSGLYSPRCDIAVGPFAFDCQYGEVYKKLLGNKGIKIFLRELLSSCRKPRVDLQDFVRHCTEQNKNPRAFIVVEVEGSSCRNGKHILGSMVNATTMGQIGIIVPYRDKTAKRVYAYIDEMAGRRKTPKIFGNLIIIDKRALDERIVHS
jgi:hypothetical protein